MRELFRRLPIDGKTRHILRSFNHEQRITGRAQSVKNLALALGFDVRIIQLPRGMNGRLVHDAFADNHYCIEVSDALSVQAQRWALLHEMAHFYLHVDRTDVLADPMHFDLSGNTFYENEVEEREANQFAAVLLFADGAMGAAKAKHGNDAVKIARQFGVTQNVARVAMWQF
jgi:Zn-dependent peptidase ImmA (M78 family)